MEEEKVVSVLSSLDQYSPDMDVLEEISDGNNHDIIFPEEKELEVKEVQHSQADQDDELHSVDRSSDYREDNDFSYNEHYRDKDHVNDNNNSNNVNNSDSDLHGVTVGKDVEEDFSYSEKQLLLISNTFPLFPSYFNNNMTLLIFAYFSAVDLIQVSSVSLGFYHTSLTPFLWKILLQRDFLLTTKEFDIINSQKNVLIKPLRIVNSNKQLMSSSSQYNHNNTVEATETVAASRSYYIQKWKGMRRRIGVAKTRNQAYEKELSRDSKRAVIEKCFDFSFLRLFVPFLFSSVFSTMLLVAMWIDKKVVTNIFLCLSPLLCFILYLVLCICAHAYLYKQQQAGGAFFGNMWTHVRGPVHYMYTTVLEEKNRSCVICLIAFALFVLQILLIGFKLCSNSVTSDQAQQVLQWELVFSPLWLLFMLFLVTPCARLINFSLFVFLFVIFWIPFFVLFVCLSIKLKGMDNQTESANMRLALILIPFWILEGAVMLGTLLALIEIVYRLRSDLRAYFSLISERLGMFAIAWGFFLPIMIAQSLVAALDDGVGSISSQDVVAPILCLLGVFFLMSILISYSYVTEFQRYRQLLMLETAGTTTIFNI